MFLWNTLYIRVAVVAFEMYEIARNSKKIRTYSSSTSSKVIYLGANRKLIRNLLLVINSNIWTYLAPFSRYCPSKLEKFLFCLPHSDLTPSLAVTPFEFCDEIWHQKTRIVELPGGEEMTGSF